MQERSDDQLVASLGQGGTLPANSSVLVSATYRLRTNMQDNHASNQLTFKLTTRVLFTDPMGSRATTTPPTLLPVAPPTSPNPPVASTFPLLCAGGQRSFHRAALRFARNCWQAQGCSVKCNSW